MVKIGTMLGAVLLAVAGCTGDIHAPAERDGGQAIEPPAAGPPVVIAPPAVMAGRLARFLWDAEPDAALVARLEAEPLTVDRLGVVADEMLSDPRTRNGVRALFRHWLLLDILTTIEKQDPERVLDPELRRSMAEEAPALGVHLTLDAPGTLAELLTAPFTFVDERLARHYEIPGVQGPDLRRVPYPAGQNRIGVMTGAGLLTLFASLSNPTWPAKRGWLVSRFTCAFPLDSLLPTSPPDPARSIREQMIAATSNPSCMGCHRLLNEPGFAFIGFDSFGRWRPAPGHGPGETAGSIPREVLADEPRFEGAAQLARLLAGRRETARCVAKQWLQFALAPGLPADGTVTQPPEESVRAAEAAFAASGYRLRALVSALVRTRAFAAPP